MPRHRAPLKTAARCCGFPGAELPMKNVAPRAPDLHELGELIGGIEVAMRTTRAGARARAWIGMRAPSTSRGSSRRRCFS